MLTHEEILQVSEWKDRVGERRPGFLHDHDHSLHGPVSACQSAPLATDLDKAQSKEVVVFTVAIERDPVTGERKLVRK
jgi:hypothetical protein